MALALVLSPCAGVRAAEDAADAPEAQGFEENLTQRAQPLLKALKLIGAPYRFGGDDPEKGLDCSGLVRHVYKDAARAPLPRSARDLSKVGQPVARAELKPGDLVFFNTRKQPNSHVGIYAGNGEFVHATSSKTKKVKLSNMDSAYWAKRFDGARRLLTGGTDAPASD